MKKGIVASKSHGDQIVQSLVDRDEDLGLYFELEASLGEALRKEVLERA